MDFETELQILHIKSLDPCHGTSSTYQPIRRGREKPEIARSITGLSWVGTIFESRK